MLKANHWIDQIAAAVWDRYPRFGSLQYLDITNNHGALRLGLKFEDRAVAYCYTHQSVIRRCLAKTQTALRVSGQWQGRALTYVLIDPRHQSVQWRAYDAWESPRDSRHPTQMLMSAENQAATKAAFLAAQPCMSDYYIRCALQLREASQHRFIDRLLFDRGDGVFDTPKEALTHAREHEDALRAFEMSIRAAR